ncbi:cytochrome P450 CYP736A12-like [Apium graveolens]|uniref:cytochrome P450 CYP736A12-like n=1 Tax=Apium graveolens TaxID=4045 RepID=UPI003D79E498
MCVTAFAVLVVFMVALGRFWRILTSLGGHKPPPGPMGLPLIGNLHLLGKLPHRTLYKLSQKYGPIMSLRLGLIPTIVVSSPAAAELFLKTHDSTFANRPRVQLAVDHFYGSKTIAFAEFGAYWRSVRKFCSLELLSPTKIDSMAGLRREELGFLVDSLKEASHTRQVVDVSGKVAGLMEDMTIRMLLGKSRDARFNLREVLKEMTKSAGEFNVADFIPFLTGLDLQGITRRTKVTGKELDNILEIIIDDHEQEAAEGYEKPDKDFVDVLLSLKSNPTGTHEQLAKNIDRSNIKAIVLDIIFGSVGTAQTAIEWIMTELIRHKRVMKLVQEEIRNVMVNCEFVEETHLSKLEYLHMVVKESMRLHPVVPLLVPHESMEDIVVDGYYIQKKSRIIINNWGLGRDPKIWSDNVEEFLPERFRGSDIDLGGQNFQLIPFGSGRRGCPGMYLGLRNVKLVVAQLVHSFEWEVPFGMSPDALNMKETFGLTSPRAEHLLAIPKIRQI